MTSPLPMEELNWAELGRRVKTRRLGMRLAQADLKARGGPGGITVRKIENVEASILRHKTKLQLERALSWPDGIVDRILDDTVTDAELSGPQPQPDAHPHRPMNVIERIERIERLLGLDGQP